MTMTDVVAIVALSFSAIAIALEVRREIMRSKEKKPIVAVAFRSCIDTTSSEIKIYLVGRATNIGMVDIWIDSASVIMCENEQIIESTSICYLSEAQALPLTDGKPREGEHLPRRLEPGESCLVYFDSDSIYYKMLTEKDVYRSITEEKVFCQFSDSAGNTYSSSEIIDFGNATSWQAILAVCKEIQERGGANYRGLKDMIEKYSNRYYNQ